jgi:hypothetical protein
MRHSKNVGRFLPAARIITVADKRDNPERYIPPATQGTVAFLRKRGHTVTIRCTRGGSFRYKLDNERERTALALSNRLRKLHGVG